MLAVFVLSGCAEPRTEPQDAGASSTGAGPATDASADESEGESEGSSSGSTSGRDPASSSTSTSTIGGDESTGSSSSGDGSTSGDTGAQSTGELEDPWDALGHEFDDDDGLDAWSLLHELDDAPEPYSLLQVEDGTLVIEPEVGGWYADWTGFFMFRELSGDFMIETDVVVTTQSGSGAPENPYNTAGLLLRDPDSAPGSQTWMTYNVGMQDGELGTEAKLTIDSFSVLDVTPGEASGVLRICRVGDSVHYARKLAGETDFTVTDTYDDVPLPDTVQAGLMTTTWNATGQDPRPRRRGRPPRRLGLRALQPTRRPGRLRVAQTFSGVVRGRYGTLAAAAPGL